MGLRFSARPLFAALFAFLFVLPASADRGLTIDAVSLNGFTGRDIRVRPGERIYGTVAVTTSSSSLFRTHTGVWMPSWDRSQSSMRVFMNSVGGVESDNATIDITAPSVPGTYYILFCFDRKHPSEMFQEITSRSDDQIYANGRAIRVFVDESAASGLSSLFSPPSSPITNSANFANAVPLDLDGRQISGTAGYGSGRESLFRLVTGNLSSDRDDAIRVRMLGDRPQIDLDLEIVDQYGRRRGLSERDGSFAEQAVVRVQPGDVLYARVFGFKRGEDAPFRIFADRTSLFTSRVDPSGGRAIPEADGSVVNDRAGEENFNPRWYSLALVREGTIDVEMNGSDPSRDIDVWIYDDLGNLRASSRQPGSRHEHATVDYAEAGTYYVKIAALRPIDESAFSATFRVSGSSYSPSDKYDRKGIDVNRDGVEFNLGGVRVRIPH